MLPNFVKNISNKLSSTWQRKASVKETFLQYFSDMLEHIRLVRYNFNNLREANIKLGIYHLNAANYSDSLLRFWMIYKFINKDDAEAMNLAAWAYYMSGKESRAIELLERNSQKDVNLFNYLKSSNKAEYIDLEIYKKFRDYFAICIVNNSFCKYDQIAKLLVSKLCEHIEELPNECLIIDYMSANGSLGYELYTRLPKRYKLIAIESSPRLIKYAKSLSHNSNLIYDLVYDDQIEHIQKKADIILSIHSYGENVSATLTKLKLFAKRDAFIFLSFELGDCKEFFLNKNENSFFYNKDFLVNELILAEFKILSINEESILEKKYLIAALSFM